jgi:hypothetical protein
MKTHIVWLLMALTFMLSARRLPPQAAASAANVCGAVNSNTTWT